jgi:hypothetical protein
MEAASGPAPIFLPPVTLSRRFLQPPWRTGHGDAINGRKDPDVLNSGQTGGISSGTHLVQQDGSSGMVSFNVSPPANAILSLLGDLYAHGSAGIDFNYNWQLDTHSVTIVCDAIQNGGNFSKGPDNLPLANLRNSDGSMTVDSIPTNLTIWPYWQFDQRLRDFQ